MKAARLDGAPAARAGLPILAQPVLAQPVLVLLVFLVLFVPGAAHAQLSPGPLSEPHRGLEGSASCLQCHAPRQGVAPDRCLACHTALAARIAAGEGLHRGPDYRRCESCHIEHHGREFELIFWGEEGRAAFDHRATGWPLVGAHRQAGCRDCHRPGHLADAARLERGAADPETTFLGLDAACLTCHRDEHRGQLGRDRCLACHGMSAWKPAPGFDHGASGFPLTGAHRAVACAACHPVRREAGAATAGGADDTFLAFTGIAHASCADCHQDPHRGRLGANCAGCHDTADFRRVDRAAFDHDRTRFPLRGRHRSVACTSCHGGDAGGERLAFGACSDCHRDPHQGRLGGACASCHDPAGWQRTDRAAFDHDRTRFPLRGEHRDLDCGRCHGARPAADRLAFGACSDCHGDPHLGQLRTAAGGGACRSCHTEEGFAPSTFTLADHQESRFPLVGSHRAVACDACHRPTEPELLPSGFLLEPGRPGTPRAGTTHPGTPLPGRPAPERVTRFRFADTSCAACHGDPHGGETATVADACTACHSLDGWSRVAFEQHAATGFALAGAHAAVACAACHPRRPGSEEPGRLRFAGTPVACAACHLDPHFGSGEGPGVAQRAAAVDCAGCHAVTGWRPARFEHGRDTGFALEGAHRRLACAACHRLEAGADGAGTRLAPLPTTCEGCHGDGSLPGLSGER